MARTISSLCPVLAGAVLCCSAPAFAQDVLPPPPLYTPPGGQPGYYQPPQDPQPPPYAQPPAQPPYAQQQPPVQQQPVLRAERPPRFGLGLRGLLGWSSGDPASYTYAGGGLEMLFHNGPRVTTELSAQYQQTVRDETGLSRRFVPVTLGLRLHLGQPSWALNPYIVAAAGFSYARLDLPDLFEQAWYAEMAGGFGFTMRASRHFSLSLDGRVVARIRIDAAERLVLADDLGQEWVPMGNQLGLALNGGMAWHF